MLLPNYLVSVVIPTHNRSQYAIFCIKSLLDIQSEQLQIVVHDTSNDKGELSAWATAQTDTRLVYVHWPERLSMTENHERAVALAQGEYVCLIGDDDSVSQRIIDVAQGAKSRGITLLTPKIKASYFWPDFKTRVFGNAHAGKAYLAKFNGTLATQDAHLNLQQALQQACQGTDTLPKLYHGLVHRTVLAQTKAKHGALFFGTSPDMSIAIGLATQGGQFHTLDFPFTIPGGAGGSNTGRSATGSHKGKLENDPHMLPFKNLNWPAVLPRFFSVETVWAHAAWETLNSTNNTNWLDQFNLARLYALCLIFHFDYRASTLAAWKAAKKAGYKKVTGYHLGYQLVVLAAGLVKSKFVRLLNPTPSNGKEIVAVVGNVQDARVKLDNRLSEIIKNNPIFGP